MSNRRKPGELYVITKGRDLSSYIFTVTDKSPKKFRFTFVTRLQNLSLNVMENLYRANMVYISLPADVRKVELRKKNQREAYVSLKVLTNMALLAMEQKCILPKQYE